MVRSDQSVGDFCAPPWLRSDRGWFGRRDGTDCPVPIHYRDGRRCAVEYNSALGWVRVVAVRVAVSNRAVLLVDQVFDTILLGRCSAGSLGLGLGVVRA